MIQLSDSTRWNIRLSNICTIMIYVYLNIYIYIYIYMIIYRCFLIQIVSKYTRYIYIYILYTHHVHIYIYTYTDCIYAIYMKFMLQICIGEVPEVALCGPCQRLTPHLSCEPLLLSHVMAVCFH